MARPLGQFRRHADYHYQALRCNVDVLRFIQIGFTFCNADGELPPGGGTWQFNFHFDLGADMYSQDAVERLTRAGVDFQRHKDEGVEPEDFAALLLTSGLVLSDDIRWVAFQSGYDFGYLLHVLSAQNLPAEEAEFTELARTYFPGIFDLRYLIKSVDNLKGNLQQLADELDIDRPGRPFHAGSDSVLIAAAFFKIRAAMFGNKIDETQYLGIVYETS